MKGPSYVSKVKSPEGNVSTPVGLYGPDAIGSMIRMLNPKTVTFEYEDGTEVRFTLVP